MYKVRTILLALIFLPAFLWAQAVKPGKDFVDSASTMVWTSVSMSVQFPFGAKDKIFTIPSLFRVNGSVGADFIVKTPSNWTFGIKGNYCFGGSLRDSTVLDNLKDHNGYIYNSDGTNNKKEIERELEGRYWYVGAGFGKVIPVNRWKNSGIWLYADFGIAQHKIYMGSQVADYVPMVRGDYKKSYDRRSTGFHMSQSVGYLFIQRKRVASFYAGIEIHEMWTRPDRNYIIGIGPTEGMKYEFSGLIGIKVAWIIPLFEKKKVETYYTF